ncbi:solute carrier family 25, member 32b [Gonapodya prolifera JEL478]|uniref:Solute carrier family 25, member 32b n=1 Tax=Gonapodya prolifera (strain JEL478) TaxID=1344416 RepID=A0A139ALK2_GONPJ|nr:solute carrier family 25, member 32b [Gonapodya prolifera JEL478]|eukprot:KXS17666.1 solute carrier family 25, member 32b [Gonapodya prolifera JEL478]
MGTISGSKATDQAIAGCLSGSFSTATLHPLDLIKTRFQVDASRLPRRALGGTVDAFRTILRSEGWRGLYRGVGPNLLGSSMSWGLYFYWYEISKTWIQSESGTQLGTSDYLLASTAAGLATQFLTNPIWVVKTRMVTQRATDATRYRSIIDAVWRMYRSEGFGAFYKGMVPALLGVSHGAIQFTIYEELKGFRRRWGQETMNAKPGPVEYVLMAALSKIVATVATSPAQVLRARLQAQPEYGGTYSSLSDAFVKLLRNEGVRGFWKGLGPNILRVLPSTMLTFGMYEWLVAAFAAFEPKKGRV